MSAGRYRVPVVLHRPVEVRAPSGAVTSSFEIAGSAFAALRLRGQSEINDGGRLVSRKTYQIRLRPFDGLTGGWRIAAGGRMFRILSVTDPRNRGREWLCEAEEEGA